MVCNAFHGIQSWWIFYYSVRNSVVPLLKALFARKRSGYTIAQACLNVLLLLWVWHALKRCLDDQCMCRYAIQVFLKSVYIFFCEHTLCRACTCTRVCPVCSLALTVQGGRVRLLYAGHLLLAWDVMIFGHEERKRVGLYFQVLYFMTSVRCIDWFAFINS